MPDRAFRYHLTYTESAEHLCTTSIRGCVRQVGIIRSRYRRESSQKAINYGTQYDEAVAERDAMRVPCSHDENDVAVR